MPIYEGAHGWILETANVAYAFGLNEAGHLAHRYWGKKLPRVEDYPLALVPESEISFVNPPHLTREEYPPYGGLRYSEPAFKVSSEQGTRDSVLSFVDSDLNGHILNVRFQDRLTGLQVTLHYRVHEQADLIERWVTFENTGNQTLTLERVLSAFWHLPEGETYRLTHLSGQWLDEFRIQRDTLTEGTKVLESRTLTTSHQHHPFFAADSAAQPSSETHGEVWFGLLCWSGNFKLLAERTNAHQTRIGLGINDWDFAWTLRPGEHFETPASVAGYTDQGFGAASRNLHAYVRTQLPHPDQTRKVLYNSWEATAFDVTVEGQSQLAEVAAQMGIELFVMDDGWFHGRTYDRSGLGDWWPDEVKFPDGLEPLIEKVKGLGMDFGLWVEPEMVNPDSDLYRAHPDWVYHFKSRKRNEARNQLILNLGREDVQNHLIHLLDDLLAKHEISFIKWDFNRYVSEPGWPDFAGDARELWVRHVQGLYRVWGTLRERHPEVIWQTCSGGGGRVDVGMLRMADQAWISDCTDPAARLQIQEGYSLAYPANTMEAWATDWGKDRFSLKFRFHVAMCGVLGIGGHILHWSDAEREEAAELIGQYKQIRHILHGGDQYRLRSPADHAVSAVQYVSKDQQESVVLGFRTHISRYYQPDPVVKLQGLDPEALYAAGEEVRSGTAWMQRGLEIKLGEFQSQIWRLKRLE
ncbi:alpha-galactosidase [Deinococcus cellulosilyticus]|uniref:Alpha-galactosidase n=1 Tax=Deinococcus cellulosilyticus (strain DSM 18568 / NBRC 106333 / KACC 11606 / 5516J-15) TaxID=1223518 RepID=A0A511N9T3_DEIC1|nr:alpha-galactosidase [Deinococcus cellulosilyticus]GEM49141.1 alpha-galactosidase [Deinococcus cellulosilyticus NBRC 106333 = KACC 11606]